MTRTWNCYHHHDGIIRSHLIRRRMCCCSLESLGHSVKLWRLARGLILNLAWFLDCWPGVCHAVVELVSATGIHTMFRNMVKWFSLGASAK